MNTAHAAKNNIKKSNIPVPQLNFIFNILQIILAQSDFPVFHQTSLPVRSGGDFAQSDSQIERSRTVTQTFYGLTKVVL
jgi:hypothetical protein